jgi:hypothetical protein
MAIAVLFTEIDLAKPLEVDLPQEGKKRIICCLTESIPDTFCRNRQSIQEDQT